MLQRGEVSCYRVVVTRGGDVQPCAFQGFSCCTEQWWSMCAHPQQVEQCYGFLPPRTAPCTLLPPPLLMSYPAPLLPAWSWPFVSSLQPLPWVNSAPLVRKQLHFSFFFNKLFFCLARELHSESNKPWSWCINALLWVWAPASPFLGSSHPSLPLNTADQKSTEEQGNACWACSLM